jgi:hypothetical protein
MSAQPVSAPAGRVAKDDVLAALDERAVEQVYRRLGVERFASGGDGNWLVHSPLRRDEHRSFTIRKADGVWCDLATGAGGSLFDAVMRVTGCEFAGALQTVADWVGAPGAPGAQPGAPVAGRSAPAAARPGR